MTDSRSAAFSRMRWRDTEQTRLEGLRRSLQLTDRILSNSTDITLKFGSMSPEGLSLHNSHAISVDKSITINPENIPHPTSVEGIANILGLNYHELAHVFFSLESYQKISLAYVPTSKQLSKIHPKFSTAYRILEEHRVETLMVAKYPSMKKYFAYPIFSIMLKENSASDLQTRHLLLHGRRYLPRKIRETYRKFFVQAYTETAAAEFDDLIDKYRVISLSSLVERRIAAGVIQDFAVLLDKYGVIPPNAHDSSGASGDGDSKAQSASKQAKNDSKEQDKKEQDPAVDGSGFHKEEEKEENDNSGDGRNSEGDAGSDSEDGSGEEDSSDAAEGGSSGGDDSDQDDSDGDSVQGSGNEADQRDSSGSSEDQEGGSDKSDKSQQSAAGSGRGSSPVSDQPTEPETLNPGEIKNELQSLLTEIVDDDEVNSEIGRFQDAMEDQSGMGSTLSLTPEKRPDQLKTVTADMINRSGRIEDELRQIWAKMDSGWNYGTSEGNRLNMERAALAHDPEDYDSIYDDWEPGQQESAGLEVVIMGDRSGSMGSPVLPDGKTRWDYDWDERQKFPTLVQTVSQNIWELMHALQEIDAQVTVLTYDDTCYTLFERGELVTTSGYYELQQDGGTNPTDAFNEARRILSQSEMPNKLLVNFTDGSWSGNEKLIRQSLESLHDTVKVAALLGDYGTDKFGYKNDFDVVRETKGDILDIMATAVMEIMRRTSE